MITTCGIYLYHAPSAKLLVCHASKASWKSWSIPKGLKEKDEEPFAAAARELLEETGIDLAALNILKTDALPPVRYKKQKKTLESFLIVTDSDIARAAFHCSTLVKSGYPEIDGWRWISLAQAPSYLHESQLANLDMLEELIKS